MKVLVVNTSEMAGGAAIAACRLTEALNRHGVKARLLVRDKQSERTTTCVVPSKGLQGMLLKWAFLWERARVWMANRFHQKGLWHVDLGIGGADIVSTSEFRDADIIHLHWVNQGFLSLKELRRILRSGKPVIWTMHDMWPCTAICHHARDCNRFQGHCQECPQLLYPSRRDLSFWVFDRKATIYPEGNLTFVACSEWLASEARKSRLLAGKEVISIPNTYNHHAFCPGSQEKARRRFTLPKNLRLLLFACQKVTNERKGLDYLFEALRSEPIHQWQGRLGLVVVGEMAEDVAYSVPFPIYRQDYINEEEDMALLYRAVDLFVTPSLEENLPNTIMEAMACATPCVGFDIGGIPEMIDHEKNGYVARYRDAEDLARGINFVLDEERYDELSANAAHKAVEAWNEESVVRKHIELYERMVKEE
jgi:glycosyltransferase involved in cell wall biosynthesis